MKTRTIVILASVLVLAAIGTYAYRSSGTVTAQKSVKVKSFTAEGQNIVVTPDGVRHITSTFKILAGEDGQRRTDTSDGAAERSNTSYCVPGLGAFTVRASSLQVRGECIRPTAKGLEALLASSRNVRVEDAEYLGIPVRHTYREYSQNGKIYTSEGWGNDDFLLKHTVTNPDGSQRVFETTSFRYEPVPAEAFAPPKLPADFSWLENQLAKTKASNDLTIIANQEQALGRLKLAFAQR
jgi:hypothetical protein